MHYTICIYCLFPLYMHLDCFISYMYMYYFAGWRYHPTFCRWCFLVKCAQVYSFMPEITKVLMRSTVSTCPRVGARCYPRYLGITRRSCLEVHIGPRHGVPRTGLTWAWHWRAHLSSSQPDLSCQAVPVSITTGLGLRQRGLLLHEVIGPRYHGMCHIWSL